MTDTKKPAALQAVKGMNDLLPPDSARWEWLEERVRQLMRRWGYANIRTPIVEPTALFVRGLGEVTDIVEKEMYSFRDALNGEELTLRLDALLNRAPLKSKANERLRLGILKQSVLDRLWRFLKDPDIPPTNNAAERSLRTVVMARKVSQCSKNAVGAQTQ